MAEPRFLFVARARAGRASWAPRRISPAGDPITPTAAGGPWVGWRLIGANNRELGRSADTFTDLADCMRAAEFVRAKAAVLDQLICADPSTAFWHWLLSYREEPVAVSARTYLRRRECLYAVGQIRAALPVASLAAREFDYVTAEEGSRIPDARLDERLPQPRAAAEAGSAVSQGSSAQ